MSEPIKMKKEKQNKYHYEFICKECDYYDDQIEEDDLKCGCNLCFYGDFVGHIVLQMLEYVFICFYMFLAYFFRVSPPKNTFCKCRK